MASHDVLSSAGTIAAADGDTDAVPGDPIGAATGASIPPARGDHPCPDAARTTIAQHKRRVMNGHLSGHPAEEPSSSRSSEALCLADLAKSNKFSVGSGFKKAGMAEADEPDSLIS
jgi:hypothetical protein